jgi:hypothetical protein
MFVAIGMEAFAERAHRERLATGEKVRKRNPETRDELTPQEDQIARLARDGRIQKSARSSSSAHAQSNGICARYSPNWTSAPAGSFGQPSPSPANPSPASSFRSNSRYSFHAQRATAQQARGVRVAIDNSSVINIAAGAPGLWALRAG